MKSNHQSPVTTVGSIISKYHDDKEYILLTQRKVSPYNAKWCLPGGHIEQNETAVEAVIREVREETGLDFFPVFFNYFDEIIPEQHIHAVPLIFTGVSSGILIKNNDEVNDAVWVLIEDVVNYDMAFHHKNIIEYYLTNHPH
jgi:ADP-ribose pyrophosphatase YjhB (NUDIX family)